MKKNHIYISKLNYDFENNIITEEFDKQVFFKWNDVRHYITWLTYYHDEKNRFVKLRRKDDGDEMITGVDYKYNDKNDIILLSDISDVNNQRSIFFPGAGIGGVYKETIYKYEYSDDKKTRFRYLEDEKSYGTLDEFFYKDNLLIKMKSYLYSGELATDTYFKYNKNNIIEIVYVRHGLGLNDRLKTTYEYDKDNRLIKRKTYYPDDIAKGKVEYIEEYYYEDGNYVYYPYLLPTKIIMYSTQGYESFIDKFVF